MNVDLLLDSLSLHENGSSWKECPGVLLVHVLPSNELNRRQTPGRVLSLREGITPFSDYQDRFELRTEITGKCWIEVELLGISKVTYIERALATLVDLGIKRWPYPVGGGVFEKVSKQLKEGEVQILERGRSDAFAPSSLIGKKISVDLIPPLDILGDSAAQSDIYVDQPHVRRTLVPAGKSNGELILTFSKA